MKITDTIRTEADAFYLYDALARHENDPVLAEVFTEMSHIERSHALAFMEKNNIPEAEFPEPTFRAKFLLKIGRLFGYDYVLGVLLDTEKSISAGIGAAKMKTGAKASLSDTAHVSILRNILARQSKVSGTELARFEKRHRSVGGNALRAAVLGGNDGLVSNFSLVMGIAGASGGQEEVLLAGLAGLLAGALSMALGEWISVKSSQELYENQMALELEELQTNPEGEKKELALIYISKGIPPEQARTMAEEAMKDTARAHTILVSEELGIRPEDLKGSAREAAVTSFLLFAVGAVVPVIPFFFSGGLYAVVFSTILSGAGLFLIGAAITLFTGKGVMFSGFRQVLFGLAAAAVTFGIGRLIGVSIAG